MGADPGPAAKPPHTARLMRTIALLTLWIVARPTGTSGSPATIGYDDSVERLLNEGNITLADVEELVGALIARGATPSGLEDNEVLARAVRYLSGTDSTNSTNSTNSTGPKEYAACPIQAASALACTAHPLCTS